MESAKELLEISMGDSIVISEISMNMTFPENVLKRVPYNL